MESSIQFLFLNSVLNCTPRFVFVFFFETLCIIEPFSKSGVMSLHICLFSFVVVNLQCVSANALKYPSLPPPAPSPTPPTQPLS